MTGNQQEEFCDIVKGIEIQIEEHKRNKTITSIIPNCIKKLEESI